MDGCEATQCPIDIEAQAQRLAQEIEITGDTSEYESGGYTPYKLAYARHEATNYEAVLARMGWLCETYWMEHDWRPAETGCPDWPEGQQCLHRHKAYWCIKCTVNALLKERAGSQQQRQETPAGAPVVCSK